MSEVSTAETTMTRGEATLAVSSFERPIERRYQDPVDLIWIATAKRLGLTIRRNPAIFSATDGKGLLELGPLSTLDADDSTAQMIFHELCHWITNGVASFHERDWGFALDAELDWREHACLRLQAALADTHGLRTALAPTSQFRKYYDEIPADPFGPVPGWPCEDLVVPHAFNSFVRAQAAPWGEPLAAVLAAHASIRDAVTPFLPDYATDIPDDPLPSLWKA
ncbi:hypothetical protein LBMAG42_37320 [Deltaproteobacteria bacterium]|nr:hypothetical protein LBMAG42_37320 [Deltaproteobacteria bacterium]